MALLKDFRTFALKGNVIDLAVAVVIGGAFGKIVSALVADLIMPLVGALTPSGDWRNFTVTSLKLNLGHLIGEIVDFAIIAFVLFLIVVKLMGALRRKQAEPAANKTCPECLETIPLQARRCRACAQLVSAAVVLFALLAARPAHAQGGPKWEFGKAEQVAAVEWKAQAKAGLIVTSGNSRTTTFTLGLAASRKQAGNKFALDAGVAYARSSILIFQDANGNLAIDRGELHRQDQTTANSWFTKARYDRFFTEHNSVYLTGVASADQPAGKDFAGGGQAGYSRQLFKTDRHEAVAELGYDLTYESYLTPIDSSVSIHSLRVFLGDTSKLTDSTSAFANVEALFNLNSESTLNSDDDTGMTKTVDALADTRVNLKAGLTTTLWKNISFSFGFTLKYDHNPAPLPLPKGAPPYAAGFQPFADTTDTITEAALIVNFL